MERYQWILKQKQKGLALFHKVIRSLELVEKELLNAKAQCEQSIEQQKQTIGRANESISQQNDAIAFLEKEHISTTETKNKIGEFLK